jgi:hypothetical protein
MTTTALHIAGVTQSKSSARKATVALDFGAEKNEASTVVSDVSVSSLTVATVASSSEELGIQGVTFGVTTTPSTGFTVTGYAPDGASGSYNVTVILQEIQ